VRGARAPLTIATTYQLPLMRIALRGKGFGSKLNPRSLEHGR
jgi:hypothetical protein